MAIKETSTAPSGPDQKLLATMLDRFNLAKESENEIRREALEDLEFRAGKQWDEQVQKQRELEKRPCLTINKLPQFVRQITNDQRQNRPAVEVTPTSSDATAEVAKIFQGIIRHIEQESGAAAAYDTAFQSAANHGFGYYRIITEYAGEKSFDQEIRIKRIRNPFRVYIDPFAEEADRSDMKWAFLETDMSEDMFKNAYPNSKLSGISDWSSVGDCPPDWVRKGGCRVVEYYYIEMERKKLVLLSNGEIHMKGDIPTGDDGKPLLPSDITVVSERETTVESVRWCKCVANEVLEKTDWLGRWVPIVAVLGDELDVDGKIHLEGVIRHAKDPMRMYNYWATAETEMIALAPKAPYIAAEGQLEGNENEWAEANVKSKAYLTYKPKALNGTLLPPPQRNVYEPPVTAITNARLQASQELKETTGIYDPSLGARSNERSGKAILARNQQSQTSNFHYIDNLARALRHGGRILVDLIPKIYDTPRAIRIIGEDGEASMVTINALFNKDGAEAKYDLSVGEYGVIVQAGPSYASKRQQALDNMLDLTQSYPDMAKFAGDLIVKNMDWTGSRELAARLRKTLPPGLAEPEAGAPPVPPEVQQQIMEMEQMIEGLTAKVNETTDLLESKQLELQNERTVAREKSTSDLLLARENSLSALHLKQLELDSKERIEVMKARLDFITTLATNESAEAQTELKAQVQLMKQDTAGVEKNETARGGDMGEVMKRFEAALEKIASQRTTRVATIEPGPDGRYTMRAVDVPADEMQPAPAMPMEPAEPMEPMEPAEPMEPTEPPEALPTAASEIVS